MDKRDWAKRPMAFERFVAPARASPQVWRLALGCCVAIGVYFLWSIGIFGALGWATGAPSYGDAFGVLFLLCTFGGLALGTVVAAYLLHGRGPLSLVGPIDRAIGDFALSALAVAAVYAISLAGWRMVYTPEAGLSLGTWLWLLPIALLALLVQTGAEELFFRGYIMQQLGARFRSPLIWAGLPTIAFALLHFDPETGGGNAWIVALSALVFGAIAVDLTARTGSIGAAWGFHFMNNFVAILCLSTKGSLTGLALYQTPYSIADGGAVRWILLLDLGFVGLAWLAARLALRR